MKYPELDGLETSDIVIDALINIARLDGILFMELWTNGSTSTRDSAETVRLVKEYIWEHIGSEADDEYYWGIEKIDMREMKKEIEHVGWYAAIVVEYQDSELDKKVEVVCPYCKRQGIEIHCGQKHFVCPVCNQATSVFRTRESLEACKKRIEEEEKEE